MTKFAFFFLLLVSISGAMSTSALAIPISPSDKEAVLKPLRGVRRIVFLGDSITYAGGYVDAIDTYLFTYAPDQVFELIDIGLPSETVSGLTEANHAGGAFPRPDLAERLDRALEKTKPDLVVACYGMNDGIYQPFDTERFRKYQEGINRLSAKVKKAGARLYLVTPPPFDALPIRASTRPAGQADYPSGQPFEGYDSALAQYSEWLISQRKSGWNAIDIHTPINAYVAERRKTQPDFTLAGDGVHLDATGHRLIAREILRAWGAPEETLPSAIAPMQPQNSALPVLALVHQRQRLLTDAWLTDIGHTRPGMATGEPLAEAKRKAQLQESQIREAVRSLPPRFPGVTGDYHGFERFDFVVDGCKATVVAPRQTMPGRPWIWRAEFFDHRPELDLALLSRGFHLAYIEVGNTFGAPSALKHWDAFYKELTGRFGLSKKPTLEGLSRGGLYVYNWASANPSKVSVVFGDNPVCDFKSWPGGKGKGPGSPDDWKKLIQDYGFKSEAEALAYRRNPVDNLAPLAKAGVPLLHLSGDADEVVPYEENTVLLRERYEKLGGKIQVIVKPGFKHHPHGLDDPTPLVDFILAHTATP
jgi:lysophospholipase L1-like esterase/pimeloyl-ACP methyl ester carboxylesterase